jgi:hypothetical protein
MMDHPSGVEHPAAENEKWQKVYCEALTEQDSSAISNACDRARHAINDRLLALAGQGDAPPDATEELLAALRQLVIHESDCRKK